MTPTSSTPKKNEKLTITLTGRPPVKITKDEWPVIASADAKEYDNQYEFQANRTAAWKLIVRQHEDGRAIVYAIHNYSSQYQGESGRDVRGGELIDAGADLPKAIDRVAEVIEARMPVDDGSNGHHWGQGVFPRLAHECIADLPAVEL
jgi:hypothetical protein